MGKKTGVLKLSDVFFVQISRCCKVMQELPSYNNTTLSNVIYVIVLWLEATVLNKDKTWTSTHIHQRKAQNSFRCIAYQNIHIKSSKSSMSLGYRILAFLPSASGTPEKSLPLLGIGFLDCRVCAPGSANSKTLSSYQILLYTFL